jgi:hypothetical protein
MRHANCQILHYAIVWDNAFLIGSGQARRLLWTMVQRTLRAAPAKPGRPVTPRETLTRIAQADLRCAYAAPGIFEVQTNADRAYTVVVD